MAIRKRRKTTAKKAASFVRGIPRRLVGARKKQASLIGDVSEVVSRLNVGLRKAGLKFVKAKSKPGWYRLVRATKRLARSR